MTVTPNFSGVTSFVAYNVPGNNCTFSWFQVNFTVPLSIVNQSFGFSGSTSLNGALVDRNGSGTFSLFSPGFPSCSSGTVNWTASTDAMPPWVQPPPPPPPPPPAPPPPPPPAPPPQRCRVPNVMGVKLASARTRIKARKCRVGTVTRKKSRKAKVGRVLKQNPRGGAVRARNFKVNLTVGRR